MYLRIAEPIELWDGTSGDPAKEFAEQPDWSMYEVGELSPVTVVASFFGNRTGHKPFRTGYVIFTETELLSTGGAIHVQPASFTWPPEVSAAHRDLMGHEQRAAELFANYDPATRLQTIPRAEFLAELAVLASRSGVPAQFRANVVKRLKRAKSTEPGLWPQIVAACAGRADPDVLVG